MKKSKYILGALALITLLSTQNFTYGTNTNVNHTNMKIKEVNTENFLSFNEIEKNKIEDIIEKQLKFIQEDCQINYKEWGLQSKDESPVKIGKGYKVYKGNSEQYLWEIPLLDKSNKVVVCMQAYYFNGEWQIGTIGSFIPNEDAELSSDITNIENKFNLKSINSIKHFRYGMPKMDVLSISTANGDFDIALSNIPNSFNKIKLKNVYKKDDFDKLIKEDTENFKKMFKIHN